MASKRFLQCEIFIPKIMMTLFWVMLLAVLSPPPKNLERSSSHPLGMTILPTVASQFQQNRDAPLARAFFAKPIMLSMNPDRDDILNHATNLQGISESKSVQVKDGQIELYSEEQPAEIDSSDLKANKRACKNNKTC